MGRNVRGRAGVRFADDETGAIILMAAVILLAMLAMSAVVVDLAFMRHDKRASQTAADMGAIAGAFALPLSPHSTAGGTQACEDAWAYVVENTPIANGAGGDPCADPDEGDFDQPCVLDESGVPEQVNVAVGEVDPYHVTITWPVPPGMVDDQADGSADKPCELIAVQIERVRGFFFAGLWGLSEGFTTAPAVASSDPGDDSGIPALIVLDPHECDALRAEGQGQVWVEYVPAFDPETGEPQGRFNEDTGEWEDAPGLIGVDTDASGTCGSSQPYALDAGTGQGEVKAGVDENGEFKDGDIWIHALAGENAAKAYRESNVTDGRVAPRPSPVFAPITRRPVDHRYNCKAAYPNESTEFVKHPDIPRCEPTDDEHGGEPRGPFVDRLRDGHEADDEDDGYRGSGPPPGDFIRYTEYMQVVHGIAGSCQLASEAGLIHLDPHDERWNDEKGTDGDDWEGWWVDCPNQFRTLADVVFSGGDVVFDGDVRAGSEGALYVNYDLDGATLKEREEDFVVFLRDGDITKSAQSTLAFNRSAVFLDDGRINLGGGAQHGELTWTAPRDGPFRALALWSESGALHEMDGQGDLRLRGVFFAPNATIEFDGQGGQLNRANAQFLSFRLTMKGQGTLVLRPDPAEAIEVPLPGAELVR